MNTELPQPKMPATEEMPVTKFDFVAYATGSDNGPYDGILRPSTVELEKFLAGDLSDMDARDAALLGTPTREDNVTAINVKSREAPVSNNDRRSTLNDPENIEELEPEEHVRKMLGRFATNNSPFFGTRAHDMPEGDLSRRKQLTLQRLKGNNNKPGTRAHPTSESVPVMSEGQIDQRKKITLDRLKGNNNKPGTRAHSELIESNA